jgi:energy-coupling factor transporter transmembrane protein EcfT
MASVFGTVFAFTDYMDDKLATLLSVWILGNIWRLSSKVSFILIDIVFPVFSSLAWLGLAWLGCSVCFVMFCIHCHFICVCRSYWHCLFNWPQAISVFIFVSWKVKLIGDMKWNPIRSDNFIGFQWNVVNKQTQSKHGRELIKFSDDHHKYSKLLICGIVYSLIILLW